MPEAASSPLLCKALPTSVDTGLTFAEPWEAKAFAIVVQLSQAGHFSWAEWVECFSLEVAVASAVEAAGGQPKGYYEQWLSAAETLLVDRGITSRDQLLAKRFAAGAVGTAHVLG